MASITAGDFEPYSPGSTILRFELKGHHDRKVITGIYEGFFFSSQHDENEPEGVNLQLDYREKITVKFAEIEEVQPISKLQLLTELRKFEKAQGEE